MLVHLQAFHPFLLSIGYFPACLPFQDHDTLSSCYSISLSFFYIHLLLIVSIVVLSFPFFVCCPCLVLLSSTRRMPITSLNIRYTNHVFVIISF